MKLRKPRHRRYLQVALLAAATATSGFAIAGSQSAHANVNVAATHYKMACRGPFKKIDIRPYSKIITVSNNKHTAKAGHDGSALPESTCAWMDRKINASEPAVVMFDYPGTRDINVLAPMLAECAGDEGCVFVADVKNTGDKMWASINNSVRFYRR